MAAVAHLDPVDRVFLYSVIKSAESSEKHGKPEGKIHAQRRALNKQLSFVVAGIARMVLRADEDVQAMLAAIESASTLPDERLDELIASTEAMQWRFKDLYSKLNPDIGSDPETKNTTIRTQNACRSVFENLEKIRWHLMEIQAERDVAEGRMYDATSIDALMGMFSKSKK